MDERYWIRLLPWRRKNRAERKSAQINFDPKLGIIHNDGWVYLELRLVNHSSWRIWVEEAIVVLIDLDAESQTQISTREAKLRIRQNVGPQDELSLSLARTIYDAAGRPQERYSCFVLTNVLYHVFGEWCNAQLEAYRVEMEALTVIDLCKVHRDNKKIKQINGSGGLVTKGHRG